MSNVPSGNVMNLLPCPFCGTAGGNVGVLLYESEWRVECHGCEVELRYFASASAAAMAWNRRAAPNRDAAERLRAILAEAVQFCGDHMNSNEMLMSNPPKNAALWQTKNILLKAFSPKEEP